MKKDYLFTHKFYVPTIKLIDILYTKKMTMRMLVEKLLKKL